MSHPSFDGFRLTCAINDGCVVFGNDNSLGGSEVFDVEALELEPELLGDQLAAGQDCKVFKHLLASVTESGCFDGSALQCVPQLVDHERRERLTLNVFGDDEDWLAGVDEFLEKLHELSEARDFLLVNDDVGIFEYHFHPLGIGHEIGAQVSAIKLHTVDDLEVGFESLVLFDADDAFLADLVHGLGDHRANAIVAVGAHGADLSDLFGVRDGV